MELLRKQLTMKEVGNSHWRINPETDVVEVSPDNGDTWYPAPDADTRGITTFPPRTGANPRCDAALNLSANYKSLVDNMVIAWNLGATVGGLVSLVFSKIPIPGALLISIAEGIVSGFLAAGAASMALSFTNDVIERLRCYFFCQMDDEGRLTAEGLQAVEDDIFASEDATVYNFMRVMFAYNGVGYVNDYATIGDLVSDGDCDECECNECLEILGGAGFADFQLQNIGGGAASWSCPPYVSQYDATNDKVTGCQSVVNNNLMYADVQYVGAGNVSFNQIHLEYTSISGRAGYTAQFDIGHSGSIIYATAVNFLSEGTHRIVTWNTPSTITLQPGDTIAVHTGSNAGTGVVEMLNLKLCMV